MRNAAYFVIISFGVIACLISGKSLLIPFVLGVLLWYIFRGTKSSLNKFPLLNKLPERVKSLLSAVTISVILAVIFQMISENIATLSSSYQKYEANIESVIISLNEQFNVNLVEMIKKQTDK